MVISSSNLIGNWDQWNQGFFSTATNFMHYVLSALQEQSIHSLAFSWMKTLSNMQLPNDLKRSSLKIKSGYWQTVFYILSQRRRSWNLTTKHVTWPCTTLFFSKDGQLFLVLATTNDVCPTKNWKFFRNMCFSSVNLTSFPIVLEKFTKLSAKQIYPSYNIVSPQKMKINQMNTRKSILQPSFLIQTYNMMCTYLQIFLIFENSQNENCNFEGVHWC